MLCTVPAYPATGYESDCDADGEYEIDLYDGSVAVSQLQNIVRKRGLIVVIEFRTSDA